MQQFVGVPASPVCHRRQCGPTAPSPGDFCTLRPMQRTESLPPGGHGPTDLSDRRGRGGRTRAQAAVAALVALLTVAALWIRVAGLTGWDGTLTVDEARLALA